MVRKVYQWMVVLIPSFNQCSRINKVIVFSVVVVKLIVSDARFEEVRLYYKCKRRFQNNFNFKIEIAIKIKYISLLQVSIQYMKNSCLNIN